MATQEVIIACWVLFIIYWTISSRNLKSVKETKRDFSNAWYISGLAFFAILFIAGFIDNPILSFSLIPRMPVLETVSAAIVVIGLMTAIQARRTIAKNWSWNIDIKDDHEIIMTGIYRYIRHPIYTGILLMSVGTFLFTWRICTLIFFLLMLAFLLFKIKEEEEFLSKHFHGKYHEYMKHTKALIPFLW